MENITHPFAPIYNEQSQMLILGSLPSITSRANKFYYGNPHNRFWKVLAMVFDSVVPETIVQKTDFLLCNRIALWDVIASCDIIGSSDASIKNVIPNDFSFLFNSTQIHHIYANGKAAFDLYNKFCTDRYGKEIFLLPSTSPANAAWNFERLVLEWKAKIQGEEF